jgi:hypothetical protein
MRYACCTASIPLQQLMEFGGINTEMTAAYFTFYNVHQQFCGTPEYSTTRVMHESNSRHRWHYLYKFIYCRFESGIVGEAVECVGLLASALTQKLATQIARNIMPLL